jgi:hypothetical protein
MTTSKTSFFVTAGIERHAISREIEKLPALHALAELVDNSFDAGSLNVNIILDNAKHPNHVVVVDTGSGISKDGIEAFFRYGRSLWLSSKHKGSNGKGSKYILWHAKQITVRSLSLKEKAVKCFTLNADRWIDHILQQQQVEIQLDSPLGAHPHDPRGTTFTLIDIEIKAERQHFFSEAFLLENLGDLLSPQYADRVYVNGQPLKPRDILGGFTDMRSDPLLGEIRAYLYRPVHLASREGTRIDTLRLGSIGPVTDFLTFARELPLELRKKVPSVFFDRSICGLIEVEGFNPWREGASKEFREELYRSDEVRHFLLYLETILWPMIRKEFHLEVSKIEDREQNNLRELQDLTQRVFGPVAIREKKLRPITIPPEFHVSPWSVQLCPGEKITFRAKGRQTDTFDWDWSDIPGARGSNKTGNTLELSIDNNATFQDNDQFKLRVKKNGGTSREAHIRLNHQKDLAIKPASGTYDLDDTLILRVENAPAKTHNLHWTVSPADAAVIENNKALTDIRLLPAKAGKITVTAKDPKNSSVVTSADFYIRAPEPVKTVTEIPDNSLPLLRIEDTTIVVDTMHGGDPNESIMNGQLENKCVTFWINVVHPQYIETLKTADSAWKIYVLMQIITRYVFLVYDDSGAETIQMKIGEILAKLSSR